MAASLAEAESDDEGLSEFDSLRPAAPFSRGTHRPCAAALAVERALVLLVEPNSNDTRSFGASFGFTGFLKHPCIRAF